MRYRTDIFFNLNSFEPAHLIRVMDEGWQPGDPLSRSTETHFQAEESAEKAVEATFIDDNSTFGVPPSDSRSTSCGDVVVVLEVDKDYQWVKTAPRAFTYLGIGIRELNFAELVGLGHSFQSSRDARMGSGHVWAW